MCRVLVSLVFTLGFLGLLIASSVKYGTSTYQNCGLLFHGYIRRVDIAYLPGDRSRAIVIALISIYKISDIQTQFVENYKVVTSLREAIKYNLQQAYANSTTVDLYKDCVMDSKSLRDSGTEVSKMYFFSDRTYLQGSVWQAMLVYSGFGFLFSGLILAFFIIESYYVFRGRSLFGSNSIKYESTESMHSTPRVTVF